MADTGSNLSTAAGSSAPPNPPLVPAAPPSRMEVERKLSFKAPTRSLSVDSAKKVKKPSLHSGNDSDTSSVISVPHLTSPTYPSSPHLPPVGQIGGGLGVGGLSAIAEQRSRGASIDTNVYEDLDEVEDEGEESEELDQDGGELQRGMEGERVIKSGFLLKKQERRKAWKRRWFVLRTGKLAYYKDDREYSLKRVLDLRSVQSVAPVTVKKHSFAFGIVTSRRTFLAKASSQDEMDDWVRAVNQARRKLSERPEDEHSKRATAAQPAVPSHPQTEAVDTHAGTYSSLYGSTTGSYASSPIAITGGYFSPKVTGAPFGEWGSGHSNPGQTLPPSPLDTASLSNQLSLMSLATSPTTPNPAPRGLGGRVVSTTTHREVSASSIGSTDQFYLQHSSLAPPMSSDEDEPYSSDPTAFQVQPSVVDPNKVILSAYLMKRSKGTGRKVWRKRWFYLTSQGLTYTKSHMDTRPLRFIPLSHVVDALEFHPESSAEDVSDSEGEHVDAPGLSRTFTTSKKSRDGGPAVRGLTSTGADEHLFRICTATRTVVLCAPSEEDEIKWLAAFRALLSRQRERSGTVDTAGPEALSPKSMLPPQGPPLPLITHQPPTPASLPPALSPASGLSSPTGTIQTDSIPPSAPAQTQQQQQIQSFQHPHTESRSIVQAGRGRSATYIAKGAVADVVRRFHPEIQQKDLPATPSA